MIRMMLVTNHIVRHGVSPAEFYQVGEVPGFLPSKGVNPQRLLPLAGQKRKQDITSNWPEQHNWKLETSSPNYPTEQLGSSKKKASKTTLQNEKIQTACLHETHQHQTYDFISKDFNASGMTGPIDTKKAFSPQVKK
ncbi:hypothetical protein PoB_006222600 [Plakobranchus ocellatus]|uniref:Uncharacterized protein n=1 Tax=Plakobranchus ocellatus TaxID=259542 RepID=A0AAV4CV34_9GAST|nr:hypothetical protein PoB_006222600 [Plakobranchus ocellatus]